MTYEEARQKTLNYIENSTKCCYGHWDGTCTTHTDQYIEKETKWRLENGLALEEWHNQHTTKLADLIPGLSARKAGRVLDELGLRVDGKPSVYALQSGCASYIEDKGFPVLGWDYEMVAQMQQTPDQTKTLCVQSEENQITLDVMAEAAKQRAVIDLANRGIATWLYEDGQWYIYAKGHQLYDEVVVRSRSGVEQRKKLTKVIRPFVFAGDPV